MIPIIQTRIEAMIKNVKSTNQHKKNHLQIMLLTILSLTSYTLSATESNVSTSKNLFLQRAFSANTTRELLMEGHVVHTDFDGFYSFFSLDAAYQRSWSQGGETSGIGAFPFWSGTNEMTVGTNDGFSSLDAWQFGLGNVTTAGTITLNPLVYQGGADFLLYFGASLNDPGVFFKFKAPLAIIGINPQLSEVPAQLPSPAQYPAGALNLSNTPVNDPALSMTQALRGYLLSGQNQNGDFIPMLYGLLDGTQLSGAQFGDIELTLGYNFICNEDNVFGLGFRASGPSANKPTGEFLLQPMLGRGGSWGVGGYIVGKSKLWENHTNSSITLNVMSTILHLLTTNTIRSYDITVNGAGSKYLLVGDYNANSYQGVIQNLINLSTLSSTSSFGVEGDVSISLSYLNNGWAADFGYNFWGRTNEKLTITETFPANRYAILGRQGAGQPGSPTTNANLCQPTATINQSAAPQNSVDQSLGVVNALTPANRIAGNFVFDIDAAQQASCATSKLFAKGSYSWLDSHFCPHLGIAGEFEMSTSANNALPQWAVSLIGGIYF